MAFSVKQGQEWIDQLVRKCAEEAGKSVRTYWRQPENGVDWNLEISSGEDEKVTVSIWFLDLKRLDDSVKARVEKEVRKGLKSL